MVSPTRPCSFRAGIQTLTVTSPGTGTLLSGVTWNVLPAARTAETKSRIAQYQAAKTINQCSTVTVILPVRGCSHAFH